MPEKRALIVDDSKTAQFRLKKLLQPYELEVDMAASAEEALGYLSYRQPVVIFMDHHMEGMDGLDALKIIKANPATAEIPVIMYTSKTDQMYMGQAHELGAIDTISKSYMKASRIEEVLAKLDIVRAKPVNALETVKDLEVEHKEEFLEEEASADTASNNDNMTTEINPNELKAQIARLFELHIADVRSQITENTKFIVRRLKGEIEEATNKKEAHVQDVPLSVISEEVHAEGTRMGLVSNSLLVLILVGIAAISFQVYQSQKQIAKLEENYHDLAELNFEENLLLNNVMASSQPSTNSQTGRTQTGTSSSAPGIDANAMVKALNWAMNTNLTFEYGEAPLGEENILLLQNLMYKLIETGFKGYVDVNIHFGNFCLSQLDDGSYSLAGNDTPVAKCIFAEDVVQDLSVENFTGVSFVQFEQTSAPIQNGEIEFIPSVSGFDDRAASYPAANEDMTAGAWNSIAAQNQRLTLSIDLGAGS